MLRLTLKMLRPMGEKPQGAAGLRDEASEGTKYPVVQSTTRLRPIYVYGGNKQAMKNEADKIQKMIYEIRGYKVMIDSDLAVLYEVETFNLNKAVKRNIGRFPADFMFQLTGEEWENLIFHFGISSSQHGGRRSMPYAFTEQGVAMLAAVLKSQKAIDANIQIMRTFVQLRHYVLAKPDTNAQIAELRKLLMLYIEKNDKRVNDIIIALNNLLEQPKPKPAKRIGFKPNEA